MRALRSGLWRFISIVVLSIVAVGTAAAQALTQVFDMPDGYSFALPADWFVTLDEEISAALFASSGDEITGFAISPSQLRVYVPLAASSDLETALIETYRTLMSVRRVRTRDITSLQLGGFPAVSYRFEEEYQGETYDDIMYVIEFGEGEYGAIVFSTLPGMLETSEPLFAEIAASFVPARLSQGGSQTASSSSANSNLSSVFGSAFGGTNVSSVFGSAFGGSAAADTELCRISASSADTVQIRVGPGFNRAVVMFLPAQQQFTVIGTTTTSSGDEWFQLIREQVAPQSGASELWVLRSDVIEAGNCDEI